MKEISPSDEWELEYDEEENTLAIVYIPTNEKMFIDSYDINLRPQIESLIEGLEELLEEDL